MYPICILVHTVSFITIYKTKQIQLLKHVLTNFKCLQLFTTQRFILISLFHNDSNTNSSNPNNQKHLQNPIHYHVDIICVTCLKHKPNKQRIVSPKSYMALGEIHIDTLFMFILNISTSHLLTHNLGETAWHNPTFQPLQFINKPAIEY